MFHFLFLRLRTKTPSKKTTITTLVFYSSVLHINNGSVTFTLDPEQTRPISDNLYATLAPAGLCRDVNAATITQTLSICMLIERITLQK